MVLATKSGSHHSPAPLFVAITGAYIVSVSIGSDILHCIFCELSCVIGAKLTEGLDSRCVSMGREQECVCCFGGFEKLLVTFHFPQVSVLVHSSVFGSGVGAPFLDGAGGTADSCLAILCAVFRMNYLEPSFK